MIEKKVEIKYKRYKEDNKESDKRRATHDSDSPTRPALCLRLLLLSSCCYRCSGFSFSAPLALCYVKSEGDAVQRMVEEGRVRIDELEGA